MIRNVTLGCDPELFLVDAQGKFIASCDKVGGTKEAPLQIAGLAQGFAVQEDNVAVEFCVPPAASKQVFVGNVSLVMAEIDKQFIAPLSLKLAFGVSSKQFDEDQLQSQKAKTFGCDPDFNVYRNEMNPRPEGREGLRTAGGHIHFGYDQPTDESRALLVRAADICLGLPSLFLDDDTERRTMYGKGGAFRPKAYGVEYRTLSNFWVRSPELIAWAYDAAMQAVDLANSKAIQLLKVDVAKMVEMAINTNNKKLAEAQMKRFGIVLP